MLFIGTSGWHYKHWKGLFYPADLPQHQYLSFYLEHFQTVEINNSFYRLPGRETFAAWRESVPPGFVFAVKASRYITHMKKLKDPQQSLSLFLDHVTALEDKLGPILFQLPPRWRCDLPRLEQFLQALPAGLLYTFEFRDPSWYQEQVYELLRAYQAAFCIYDLEQHQSPIVVTAGFVYVRLHGPEGRYTGSYTDEALAAWAARARDWQAQGRSVYFYFDNDIGGYAVGDARRLQHLLAPGT